MMKTFCFALLATGSVLASRAVATDTWPQFRGPEGQGHSDARGLPLHWGEDKNVKWKVSIHGRAWSSPVVWADQIWVTTATEDGRELSAVCVDRETGRIVHDLKLFDVANPQFAHKFNSYASPTPVIEAGRIYVTFGSPGTVCLDTRTGKVLWSRRDFECNHFRGAGSSPIVFGDLLIMNFDGSDHQFMVALNKNTGDTVWRVERSIDFKDLGKDGKPEAEGDFRKAFSTPHVFPLDGTPMLVSSGAKAHYAYNPLTGREYWRVEERSCHSASARPVYGNGLLFLLTGFSRGQLLAVRPTVPERRVVIDAATAPEEVEGAPRGDAGMLEVIWKVKRNVACKPSVLLVDQLLYMVDDGGIASCIDSKIGQEVWRERVGGNHSASPVYADGRIYLCNEEGKTTVLQPGREFRVLAENQLDDGFMASPAVAGQALYLRTKSHLYRIEEMR